MKRVSVLLLMIVYMASAIGVTISQHYCGGHFKQICFTADTEDGCCEQSEHKTRCCTDKVLKANLKDHHSASAKVVMTKVAICTIPTAYPCPINSNTIDNCEFCGSYDPSPPRPPDIPIYLLHRNFRI